MKHLVAALCILPSFGWAEDFISPLIGSFEAGVLCAPDATSEREAPDTLAGTTHVIDEAPPFVSHGRIVPAVIGVGFGVKSGTKDMFGLDGVTIAITHPPMGPEGITSQSFVSSIGVPSDPGISFYQFDYDYELVLGDWTIEARIGDAVFYSTSFTVVSPDLIPELAEVCGYVDLLG